MKNNGHSDRLMMQSEGNVRQLVKKIVYRTLGRTPGTEHSSVLVSEAELQNVEPGSSYPIPKGALITPLARQLAMDRRISLEESNPAEVTMQNSTGKVIALGADHGGFALKTTLLEYLTELGYQTIDCGTDSDQSVDYPDFALAVAGLVSQGEASLGIIIDGAGIGSSMAANKVPGVLAAMCYDQATAINSREHNNANVLTLGAGMIGANLARQIVEIWLDTAFAGGRHQRRIDKIHRIEQRFMREHA
jgi:ribose 5-phosphate isomerase B